MKAVLLVTFLILPSSLPWGLSAHPGNPPPRGGMHGPVGEIPTGPGESLFPLAPPAGEEIVCPAEFCRADGVFLTFETRWGSTQILMDIAHEIAQDDTVYMFVKDAAERNEALDLLTVNGVNLDHVRFVFYPSLSENCIWVRDYGPLYVLEDGLKAVVDFWYPFTSDDDVPITVGGEFGLPVYGSDLLFSLGNFMTDGRGMGFATNIIYSYNPGYSEVQVRQVFRDYCGIDSLVVLPILDVENTKHIDVFCKLVNDTTFLVGEYAAPSEGAGNNYYILNDMAVLLEGLRSLEGRDFTVVRIPMPPWEGPGTPGVTRTYANSLIMNDKVLVPVYGIDMDADALAIYQSLFPGHEVIGIDSEQIIHRAGAVHCITSSHHSDNPLIILHAPPDSIPYGASPSLHFSLNPRFAGSQASVRHRSPGDTTFSEVEASLSGGVWHAGLPGMEEDFQYYIAASVIAGGVNLEVNLPADAPAECFAVQVAEPTSVAVTGPPPSAEIALWSSPNPFTMNTEIRYAASAAGPVDLVIFDLSGRAVRRFENREPGLHVIRWDGRDAHGRPLGAGMYFCRLEAASKAETVKLLLLR